MDSLFDLESYLAGAITGIIGDIIKSTLHNPKESLFMAQYAAAAKKAAARREYHAKNGGHIPPFIIASISASCNLHCKGCYARENNICSDTSCADELTGEQWGAVFKEAEEMGVAFILLAGGEPFLRPDVLEAAGNIRNIIFPVFTNGTVSGEKYIRMFDRCRNLLPIISIEGDSGTTDMRRGSGVFLCIENTMDDFTENGILYGVSVTVTADNLNYVTSETFIGYLRKKGSRAVIYVEYVPANRETALLAIDDAARAYLGERVNMLRSSFDEMLFISFPGDEKDSGGCLAAGRGFFHINSRGGAEPCPFSPYSDINIKQSGLRGALRSGLFEALRSGDLLGGEHKGGCVLFEKRDQVARLLNNTLDNGGNSGYTVKDAASGTGPEAK